MNRIFVAALKEETQDLNFFYHTGAGKINATYNLTKLIKNYKPKEVINFGTAGAVSKNLEGIIETEKLYDRIRMLDCDGYPPAFIETKDFRFEFSRASLRSEKEIFADVRIIKK